MDRSGFPSFTVSHYNGAVTYTAEGFLDRNLDAINPDCLFTSRCCRWIGRYRLYQSFCERSVLCQGYCYSSPSSKRRRDRCSSTSSQTDESAFDSEVEHHQNACLPSTKAETSRSRTKRKMRTILLHLTGGASPCVAGEFKSALDTLFETIEETQSWYVFCVNPNDSQLPNQLEGRSVKGQVKAVGMTEMARRCINVFEVRSWDDPGGILRSLRGWTLLRVMIEKWWDRQGPPSVWEIKMWFLNSIK